MDTEWLAKNADQLFKFDDGNLIGEGDTPEEALENAKLQQEANSFADRVGL